MYCLAKCCLPARRHPAAGQPPQDSRSDHRPGRRTTCRSAAARLRGPSPAVTLHPIIDYSNLSYIYSNAIPAALIIIQICHTVLSLYPACCLLSNDHPARAIFRRGDAPRGPAAVPIRRRGRPWDRRSQAAPDHRRRPSQSVPKKVSQTDKKRLQSVRTYAIIETRGDALRKLNKEKARPAATEPSQTPNQTSKARKESPTL